MKNEIDGREAHPRFSNWKKGAIAAERGDFEQALNCYRAVLQQEPRVACSDEFLNDVLDLDDAGVAELKRHRDSLEERLQTLPLDREAKELWSLINRKCDKEHDLIFYERLSAIRPKLDVPRLSILESRLARLLWDQRFGETRSMIADVSRVMDTLYEHPVELGTHPELIKSWILPRVCANATRCALALGDDETAQKLCAQFLTVHPTSTTYFMMEEVDRDYGDRLKSTLGRSFEGFALRLQIEILIADVMADADPEQLISAGAPRDEYNVEALAVTKELTRDTTESDLESILSHIWRRYFGTCVTVGSNGKESEPYPDEGFEAPDLKLMVTRIFAAIREKLPDL